MLFVDDYTVGCRKDLNGILLLDTALQPPVAKPEDMVQLELPVTEVRDDANRRKNTYLFFLSVFLTSFIFVLDKHII